MARDDLLDALAAAVTAQLGRNGLETIPQEPEVDDEGLPMEIVYVWPDPDSGLWVSAVLKA